jgi:hypothetical protein
VIQAAIALWALFLAYRLRGGRHEWILVSALLGGMLATPYLHLDDLVMLGLAAWLYLRTDRKPPWVWAFLLGLVIAIEGIPIWGPLPLIVGELIALALLSVAALKHHDSHAEHHSAEAEHNGRLQSNRKQIAVDGEP